MQGVTVTPCADKDQNPAYLLKTKPLKHLAVCYLT